jgi:uncharacterized RDD family membrane protein YckC
MVAYAIDNIILSLLLVVFGVLSYFILDYLSIHAAGNDPLQMFRLLFVPLTVTSMIIEVFYFSYCHAVTGQTIGKWICGIRVVSKDGKLLGFKRAFVRWIGYFISRFFLYLGFFWVAIDKQKQG